MKAASTAPPSSAGSTSGPGSSRSVLLAAVTPVSFSSCRASRRVPLPGSPTATRRPVRSVSAVTGTARR